jgi:glycosyltransferase involved in cell wall biosynthesis
VVHCIRSDTFAGVERYVAYVAPELCRRGWDVTVVGGDPQRMRAELGQVRHLPAATTGRVLAELMRLERPALVHAHMTAAEAAAAAAHVTRHLPVVVTRHFAAPRGSSPLVRLGARVIRASLERQISISRFVADAIGEPSTVLLNGVPVARRTIAADLIVLMAQRLEPEKKTDVAIEAWARSALRHEGWRMVVAGSGRQRAELADRISQQDLGGSVTLLGMHNDMAVLMSRASIFLATAPAEPFGFSVVEAMAAGVPVVAARGGAHTETVGSVSSRWLFSAGDAGEAASMLDALGHDPDGSERYGDRLRAAQQERLSLDVHVDCLEAIYRDVVK